MGEAFLVRVRFKDEVGYHELVGWLLRNDNKKLYIKPLGKDGEEKISR